MIIMTHDGYATAEGVRAMLEMEDEGAAEYDREHSDALWNAAGSRAQAAVDALREVA